MSTFKELAKVYEKAKKNQIILTDSSKIILFSDCHRGIGDFSDDFAQNHNIYNFALKHYYKNGFTYIEIGDGEELWENNDFNKIRKTYDEIYDLLSLYHKKNRLYLIWGNHNKIWANKTMVTKYLNSCYSEKSDRTVPLFNNIIVHEALVLKYKKTDNNIFIIHGHQGQLNNDRFWRISKFFTHYFWKFFQIIGFKDPTSTAQNYSIRKKVEKKLKKWAKKNNRIIIAGHTHRSVFPDINDFHYFNTGSCVHPRCITGIEIKFRKICLVKWFVNTRNDGTLFIDREELAEPVELTKYFKKK